MFSAYAYAISHASMPREVCDGMSGAAPGPDHLELAAGPAPLDRERLERLGQRTRAGFLQAVEKKILRGMVYCGLSLPELLIDVSGIDRDTRDVPPLEWPEVQEYLRRMRS